MKKIIILITFFTIGSCSPKVEILCKSFNLKNIDKIVFRAIHAKQAKVFEAKSDQTIKVCATPSGDVVGYHSPNPDWKMKTPSQWGFDFRSKTYGRTLVISSFNEYVIIHHDYRLIKLKIFLPNTIKLIKENRGRTHESNRVMLDGTPDLRPPN